MSVESDFKSKLRNHALQPGEINLIASLAVIFRVAKGRDPTLAELKNLWEKYGS